mgnify:CR=1 FL=1
MAAAVLLNMYLPGQNGGEATYSLLFGESSPCGKLAETWPYEYADVPFGDDFGKTKNEVYKESVFVGYRYYISNKDKVRFPFGFGLSYAAFEYSELDIRDMGDSFLISAKINSIIPINPDKIMLTTCCMMGTYGLYYLFQLAIYSLSFFPIRERDSSLTSPY